MGEPKEKTELEKAKALLQKDLEVKGKKCKEEIEQVLKKYGLAIQPISTNKVIQQFINLIPLCGIDLVSTQQRNNGDKRDSGNKG